MTEQRKRRRDYTMLFAGGGGGGGAWVEGVTENNDCDPGTIDILVDGSGTGGSLVHTAALLPLVRIR